MESTSKSRKAGEETPCLAEEIILEEILPRVPVKSLLKFRCVSKSWCSLIGSKRFMKSHLQNSINTSSGHQLIFFDGEFKLCSLPSLFNKPSTDPITCNADLGIEDEIIHVGCCNGLDCILLGFERFILWNPATKKFKNLPHPCSQIQIEFGPIKKYGFGFDELNDDYKIFGIVNLVSAPTSWIGLVYSLRTNLWTDVEGRGVTGFGGKDMGMHMNGKLHWRRNEGYECEIVTFDLSSHVYGVVELPKIMKGDLFTLGVVGGCLSVHIFRRPNLNLDVWLMNEYGVKESWVKVATVPRYRTITTPIAIGPNGEVLLRYHSRIVIYNPKCGVFRHPQITGLDESAIMVSMGIYIESLASVASDAEAQQEI